MTNEDTNGDGDESLTNKIRWTKREFMAALGVGGAAAMGYAAASSNDIPDANLLAGGLDAPLTQQYRRDNYVTSPASAFDPSVLDTGELAWQTDTGTIGVIDEEGSIGVPPIGNSEHPIPSATIEVAEIKNLLGSRYATEYDTIQDAVADSETLDTDDTDFGAASGEVVVPATRVWTESITLDNSAAKCKFRGQGTNTEIRADDGHTLHVSTQYTKIEDVSLYSNVIGASPLVIDSSLNPVQDIRIENVMVNSWEEPAVTVEDCQRAFIDELYIRVSNGAGLTLNSVRGSEISVSVADHAGVSADIDPMVLIGAGCEDNVINLNGRSPGGQTNITGVAFDGGSRNTIDMQLDFGAQTGNTAVHMTENVGEENVIRGYAERPETGIHIESGIQNVRADIHAEEVALHIESNNCTVSGGEYRTRGGKAVQLDGSRTSFSGQVIAPNETAVEINNDKNTVGGFFWGDVVVKDNDCTIFGTIDGDLDISTATNTNYEAANVLGTVIDT